MTDESPLPLLCKTCRLPMGEAEKPIHLDKYKDHVVIEVVKPGHGEVPCSEVQSAEA